jgi:DNA-binding transcriptional regulator YiaG
MLKEAEITNQTGIMYLRDGPYSNFGAAFSGTGNLLNPTFSWTATGEDSRPKPDVQPDISQSLLPYKLLSATAESELHENSVLLAVLLLLAVASDRVVTDYRATFEFKNWIQTKSHTSQLDQASTPDTNSASFQAERLREVSGLKVERLAEIFDVSRTTYHKWISGSPPHDAHREHLLEVVSLVEEAAQRLGSPSATNTWLLTPVSPGGKKPIEYLSSRQYNTFRGFLLRVHTGREMFRPLTPSSRVYKERSPEEVKDALERLRPRAWRDDDLSDTDGEEV